MAKRNAKLTIIAERADPDVVKVAERYLELAKAGKIRSIAIAAADKGGKIESNHMIWSQDRANLYVAIERLQKEILDYSS